MTKRKPLFSRRLDRFRGDRRFFALVLLLAILVAGRAWLEEHPGDNPWAPLDLRDEPGWATATKLQELRRDPEVCRAVLERSDIKFAALPPAGQGECERPDRTKLTAYPLRPDTPPTTCSVAAALVLWKRDSLDLLAGELFDSKIDRIEHLGAYSCRRLYGRSEGAWSQHATGNAIDIAGFVLTDGTRISVLNDWGGEGEKAAFLHRAREGACGAFSTVLSPDYNAAHRDHFHLDMTGRWSSVCR